MELIHIKLNFDEVINSERKLLSSEISLLELIKKIQTYKELRKREFNKKADLKVKVKKVLIHLNAIRKNFPKVASPFEEEEAIEIKEKVRDMGKKISVESELKDIRKRLQEIASR